MSLKSCHLCFLPGEDSLCFLVDSLTIIFYCGFTAECSSEKISKIIQYFDEAAKLQNLSTHFLNHPVHIQTRRRIVSRALRPWRWVPSRRRDPAGWSRCLTWSSLTAVRRRSLPSLRRGRRSLGFVPAKSSGRNATSAPAATTLLTRQVRYSRVRPWLLVK